MCTTSSDAMQVLSATRLRFYLILLLMVWRFIFSYHINVMFLWKATLHTVFTPSVIQLRAAVGFKLMLWIWALPAFIFTPAKAAS
ncbi:hypothetical protein F4604DRAFT_918924 [Suillus subluteus]|nr:hypothetical protein F4604DRAFT_918924 [Suillus subluteus]